MTHMRAKMTVASLVLVLGLAYLVVAGVKSGWVYYLPVDSYLSDVKHQDQRVRLHGRVAADSVVTDRAMLTASFELRGETRQMPIRYSGIVPDEFKPGSEVVVEGKRDAAGMFQADVLMTKCASKYEHEPQEKTEVPS